MCLLGGEVSRAKAELGYHGNGVEREEHIMTKMGLLGEFPLCEAGILMGKEMEKIQDHIL